MDTFIFVVNIIGTLAFAASGAMIGLNKNMDIFGVCILGLATATGGGVIRDLILGLTPPMAFRDPTYAVLALATSAVFFSRRVRRVLMHNQRRYDRLLFWMDTLGLGVFSVAGVELAFSRSGHPTFFLLVFIGTITGVGAACSGTCWPRRCPIFSSSTSTPAPPWPGRRCAPDCGGLGVCPPCWPG